MKDELIHKSIQDNLMTYMNRFYNRFENDLDQDRHQGLLTIVNIHT